MDSCALTDGTVWLSRPTEADADRIIECCQEPSIGEWTTIPVPYHREQFDMFMAEFVVVGWAGRSPTWAVRTAEDGPAVGMVGLSSRDKDDPTAAEIGYWVSSQARGRGLATRATRLVCDFGFRPDGLALIRIEWRAIVGNHASAAVARRAGFHYEGLLRLGNLQRGIRRDCWIASRLATDPPGPATWPPGL
ncbi:GNAT family N-acetyltransferase [Nocardia transvalensis]|nr:GNAT family N-acetyltransferase [Nocardia transvalensis]MBF6332564.1 GNAT family N-acetyltransferase [Nocardia transvalensis]